MTAEEVRLRTFGPDKILGPEYAEHIQGVVVRAINRHARLGIVRERIADAVAQALTGKEMRPTTGTTQRTSTGHITPASPQPGVSAEQLEALIAHGREHGHLYLVAALTELRELRAMSARPPASSRPINPYATHDLEVARHTLRGLEGHLGKQDFGVLERGLNAAGAALDAQETPSEDHVRQPDQRSPVTYVDLLTGQPVAEDAEWCPDCKRLAEEDGDILPPACAAHGGRPGHTRLRAAREAAGLSIEQASKRLDWSTWLIERYESGNCVPPPVCLRRLADTYGVSVAWLQDEPLREGR